MKAYKLKIILSISAIILFPKLSFSQLTKLQLEKIYKKNDSLALVCALNGLSVKTPLIASTPFHNDTLDKIHKLLDTILSHCTSNPYHRFYFLQAEYPKCTSDKHSLALRDAFLPVISNDHWTAIKYDGQTIEAILSFLNVESYSSIRSEKKKGDRFEKIRTKKFSFINKYLYIPMTWGRVDESLVPFKIISIDFSDKFRLAEVLIHHSWKGETASYIYENENWHCYKRIREWVH